MPAAHPTSNRSGVMRIVATDRRSTCCGTIVCTVRGSDGDGGIINDLLFDDSSWRVRWIVVDTHHWFCRECFCLCRVTAARRGGSPSCRRPDDAEDFQQPGSRAQAAVSRPSAHGGGDPHCAVSTPVIGHRVHLADSIIGDVGDLLVQDADRGIRFLQIDTCKWRPGERVLVAPRAIGPSPRPIPARHRSARVLKAGRYVRPAATQLGECLKRHMMEAHAADRRDGEHRYS
jgi:hypothetical protein